ncbi:FAD/NAD(P)-binding domain-containing protein [Calocera viscosa TUFC12733]|uniref:FAD/NAD(P)-binding domain-containing protein n=1 Tax=Calocera viscosa (strain TUFC12733) TaxID=1330018 RepID=A0A167QLY4_CALVF|nr:FAD/NAD(P)-binding domain-containing protein [Calocera viscosa TUFC12733]
MPHRARRSPPKPGVVDSRWKNVLVLGGSYGGARAARVLAEGLPPGYRVLLIERQSHFNHLYVFPRYIVVPHHEHKAFIPYADLNPPAPPAAKPKPKPALYPEGDDFYYSADMHFPPSRSAKPTGPHLVLHATVKEITRESVTLNREFPEHELGTQVPYAFLIYALGSVMPKPLLMPPDALYKLGGVAWMIDQGSRIRRAKHVVVVGGGALGIQYASDIKDHYPQAEVTLIHSRAHLLPRFDPAMHPLIKSHLHKLGVDVILGDRLLDPTIQNGRVHTLKGREIECDHLILCTGQQPNTALLAGAFADALNPLTGHATVLRTMQLCPYDLPSLSSTSDPCPLTSPPTRLPPPRRTPWPNLFAIGDAADAFGAIKAGHTAHYQAETAARNVLLLIAHSLGQRLTEDLEEYTPGAAAIKLTVGVRQAIVQKGEGIEEVECGEDLDAEVMWKAMGADATHMWE